MTRVFVPDQVGSLPSYFAYLFQRFPGRLGPETSVTYRCFDTYDGRWSARGRLWVQSGGPLVLVEPPSLVPLDELPGAFGLQAPVSLGQLRARRQGIEFVLQPPNGASGELITVTGSTYLILSAPPGEAWTALEAVLKSEGWADASGRTWWPKGLRFEGPRSFPASSTTPAAAFLAVRIRDALRVARLYERGVLDDVDTECLHQYRVHLRRARALLGLGTFWSGAPGWRRLKDSLRELQQKTNEQRDLDVLLLEVPRLRASLPWGEGDRLQGWVDALGRSRAAEARRIRTWLRSETQRQLQETMSSDLDALEAWDAAVTAGELAPRASAAAAKKLLRAVGRVTVDGSDERLHEVRILAKKVRYALESWGPLVAAEPAARVLGQLKRAQTVLGQFQDGAVLLDRLRRQLTTVRSPGRVDPVAWGLLVGILVRDHDLERRAAMEAVLRLASRSARRVLQQLAPTGGHDGL